GAARADLPAKPPERRSVEPLGVLQAHRHSRGRCERGGNGVSFTHRAHDGGGGTTPHHFEFRHRISKARDFARSFAQRAVFWGNRSSFRSLRAPRMKDSREVAVTSSSRALEARFE